MLAHGFGCDQNMWRFVTPALEPRFRVVSFDYVGAGESDITQYDPARYGTLEGYARDIVEICESLDLRGVTVVGHSVSATTAMIAALAVPERIDRIIMVCPSPCFMNKPPDYFGGFERPDLEELLDLIDKNYIGWAHHLAPLVLGRNSSDALVEELTTSFCSTDPLIAKTFAQATFLSDHRYLFSHDSPPALLLQSRDDMLAPLGVGDYLHRRMPQSTLRILETEGHCPHMTAPDSVTDAIVEYMDN